jgi:glycosyltransferase involved in cell wall biosynthesis
VRAAVVEQLESPGLPEAWLIYNTFDCERFNRERLPGAEFRLGMLGYCPKLKNPRLAVEILDRLRRHDQRWRLVLTGSPPRSYDWLWARDSERAYYEAFEQYVEQQQLAGHLERQEWTDDSPAWYANVGFLLSCSDLEGSHQAVAEGMASGCVPVVRRWQGAEGMYPNSLLFDTAEEAEQLILECANDDRRAELVVAGRREARTRFDTRVILPQLEQVLMGEPIASALADRAGQVDQARQVGAGRRD